MTVSCSKVHTQSLCTPLVDKITELDGWMSTLYQIQEAEQLLDSITFSPAITNATCSNEPGAAVEAASLPESCVTAHQRTADTLPPPATAPNDSWLRLGAKPKALVSSTPSCHKSRKLVGGGGRGDGPLLQPHYNYNIQLKNKYELLAPLFTSSAILGIGKKFTVTSFPPSLLLAWWYSPQQPGLIDHLQNIQDHLLLLPVTL